MRAASVWFARELPGGPDTGNPPVREPPFVEGFASAISSKRSLCSASSMFQEAHYIQPFDFRQSGRLLQSPKTKMRNQRPLVRAHAETGGIDLHVGPSERPGGTQPYLVKPDDMEGCPSNKTQ